MTFTGNAGASEDLQSLFALHQPKGKAAQGSYLAGLSKPLPGCGNPRSFCQDNFWPPGDPSPTSRQALGAGACTVTRAVPMVITSSVLSPPPSLPELLGLAVPLASLGGS